MESHGQIHWQHESQAGQAQSQDDTTTHPHDSREDIAIGTEELDTTIVNASFIRYLLEDKH